MASVAIPIQQIQNNGRFGASLMRPSLLPTFLRRLLALYFLPKILRFITDALSGETLGKLSTEQAAQLYDALNPLFVELASTINQFPSCSWLTRKLLGRWMESVSTEADRLEDIVETLAWGSDPEAKAYIHSAIEALERTR